MKKYYTIKQLKELGFPEARVRELLHSEVANLIALPRRTDKDKYLINLEALEKYWGWQ